MPEQVYTLVLPDGREVDVQSDHEPTKEEAIKIMRSMGVEPEGKSTLDAVKGFFAEPEVKAAGARLVGGMGGAMTGAVRGGPVGGIVGGLIGAAVAEPVAQTITPRKEGIAETVTNIGLAGIQPKRSVGTLLQRIGREAAIGGGLGAAQATVVPVIDEGRLPTRNELLMGGGMGAGIGGLLGGVLPGPKEAPKATPITDQLGNASTKNTTTEANQAANAIAMTPPKPVAPPAAPAQPFVPQAGAPKEFDFQRDARLFQAGSAAAKEAEASLAFESGKKAAKAVIPQEIAQEIAASEDPIAAAFEAGRKSAIGAEDAVRAERQGEKVVEDLTFEAGREGAIAAETKLKQEAGRNQAVKYIGDQELGEGQFMSLYNLTEDIVDEAGNVLHPANSTVSAQTLEKYGIPVPEAPKPPVESVLRPSGEVGAMPVSPEPQMPVKGKETPLPAVREAKPAAKAKKARRASVSDEAAIEAEAARQAGTRALQAGITGNPATSAVAGGAIGYATGDTPEERIERAGYGALAGLGVGAAASRAATRPSVRPAAPARPATRAEAMKDFAPQMPKYEAPPPATAKLGPQTLFNKAPDATVPSGSAATPPPADSGTATKGAAAETVSEKWLNENRPIRNFDKRIIDNPDVPQEMRDALASNPDIHYEIAHHKQTARAAAGSTDAELEMMVKSGDLAERTAALNEQSNRAAANGDMAESARLHNLASQNLTPAAQQVSLARFLWSPWADLAEVEGAVVKTGRNLTEEQRKRVVELSINKIEAEKALAEIERLAKESFTDENIKKLRLAKVDAALARKAYDEYAIGLEPKFLGDILSKAIQGNLLTPLSLVANVFGNMFWLPVRKMGGAAGSLIDLAYSKTTGAPRSIMQGNPFPSMAELKAAIEGAKVAGKELLTGPSVESYAKSEVNRGFQPIRSLLQGITGKDLPVGKDGQVLKWDRTKSIIEGLVGGPPEVFFRLLNLGDKPFRRAAEVEAAREFASIKGLKGRDLEYFLTFPTKKGAKELDEMARRATFTQENKLISQLNKFLDADAIKKDLPAAAGAIKAFNRMIVPFRQFPVNYVQTAINFVSPEIALAKAIYYSAANNPRKARIAGGEAMVGAAIYTAAEYLWRKGIISEPTSKDAKTRSAQYDRMGPQKFNISGLERSMNGEDGAYRTGDKLVDWGKMGIPAAVFYLTTQRNSEKLLEEAGAGKVPYKPKVSDPLTRRMEDPASVIQSFPGLLSFSLDQSFLAGASSLLEAWKDPDPDSGKFQVWAANMFRAVTSMAIPNTAEAVARARMEFVPELKGDTNLETFKNIFKFKMNMMDPEDRPLLKRDLWGEPIRRAPKDSSGAWAQQMFDVVKYGRTEVDPFKDKLIAVYNQTEKPDVYPTPPTRVVSLGGSTVKLMPNHYEQLQETVGRMRREVAEKVVNTAGFNRLDAMEKVYVLERVYSEAGSAATTQFLTRRDILDEYFPMFTGKGRQSENERTRRMDTKSVIIERAMNR